MKTEDPPRVGLLLRDWRQRRKFSQLDLALRAETSTRHLSCVETGRARPSREMVLRLAEHLDVPLRDRNSLLLAAGYAPAYQESPLDSDRMAMARQALRSMLAGHEPYPAAVVDRVWNIVDSNRSMSLLLDSVPPTLTAEGANVMRLILHPDGLPQHCLNFAEVRAHALGRLLHQANGTGHPELRALYDEVSAYPPPPDTGAPPGPVDATGMVVPLRLRTPFGDMALFSMIATFGAPADVTLSELAVETFFPMDEETARLLRLHAAAADPKDPRGS
ncbi:helix-turn-helix transcriptional regulator [Streptomyces sp. NBC_00190]|uniref:helix-turn-helix domain-containing protein n=1 Tax=unclassified Streptomyces TaxID=2593676 RepID=UPI002E2C7E4F|nr:helix-turn-helix transcriptional regulator [Streptomyces sp. NBC_00190]WSZ45205.1 helix-turn-helix transcriptional regulator [Streptomyces sp. NBC_00868]